MKGYEKTVQPFHKEKKRISKNYLKTMETIESVTIPNDKKIIVERVSSKVPKVHGIFNILISVRRKTS